MDAGDFRALTASLAERERLPAAAELRPVFRAAADTLENLAPAIRPRASDGRAGGLVELAPDLPAIIVPDLHARPTLLRDLLSLEMPGEGFVADLLDQGRIQVVMVGDGPHTEGILAAWRWQLAEVEFQSGWVTRAAMDEEMTLAFNAMEIVARLVCRHPGRFLFLKGNHDNILNEDANGNRPFGKYAQEGRMASDWTRRFLGEEFLRDYDAFERAMPLMARGAGFLVTHAEPAFVVRPEDVIEGRSRPEVVYALTWTANDAAKPEAVAGTLAAFLDPAVRPGMAFGGHRPVSAGFALRAGGRFVQIHDQQRRQVVMVRPGLAFDPLAMVINLDDPA